MAATLNDLLKNLEPDPWRREIGFTPEVEATNERMFSASNDPEFLRAALNEWLRKYQPCLFGRAAATQNAIEYCFLYEDDLEKGDDFVREKISHAHLGWTRAAFEGRSSNFILLVVSPNIVVARPNHVVLEFARRLAQLYLQEDEIQPDRIYHDVAYLAIPSHHEHVYKWKAGVNYFSAHGDRRWWQDHRIPGGLGFSTNSVGHLVKSGKLLGLLSEMADALDLPAKQRGGSRIESLGRALQVAMQTIANASDATSGKATELVPLPGNASELPVESCPVDLGPRLADKNFCWYKGYYHTDETLPSLYFRDDVFRPDDALPIEQLDFTYLFNKSAENPAHETMGAGIPIRTGEPAAEGAPRYKRERVDATEVAISSEPRLLAAL